MTGGRCAWHRRLAAALLVPSLLTVASCAGDPVAPPYHGIDPADFVATITNPYFPLSPGVVMSFVAENAEDQLVTSEVLTQTRSILGVPTTVVRTRTIRGGVVLEAVDRLYAEDVEGTVWILGADWGIGDDADERSWEAGVDGARPGIGMWGDPAERIGVSFTTGGPASTRSFDVVVGIHREVDVPFGTFGDCIEIERRSGPTTVLERRYHCPLVGLTLRLKKASTAEVLIERTEPTALTRGDVVLAAGDIARCDHDGDEVTAAMLDTLPGLVLTLGDHAYFNGTLQEFRECYEPSWGRHRSRTRPVPGNHEYGSPGAAPYFAYFGDAAGPPEVGYYSFELGAWHVVALNSNIDMSVGSPQERWLRADLAGREGSCILAYWHHPRYSSGRHGGQATVTPLWRALSEAGADVVLQAHDHVYERFAPMGADGELDPERGIRSFVVGTGGAPLYAFAPTPAKGSRRQYREALGLLRLELHAAGYGWSFLTTDGLVMDRGADGCWEERP